MKHKKPMKTSEEMGKKREVSGKRPPLLEMSKLATFSGHNLIVWTDDEVQEPHFHVTQGRDFSAPNMDCCIKIGAAEYLPHHGHCDQLSQNHLAELVKLLKSKDEDSTGEQTFWQSLLGDWNRNNPRRKVPLTTQMPDYLHMGFPAQTATLFKRGRSQAGLSDENGNSPKERKIKDGSTGNASASRLVKASICKESIFPICKGCENGTEDIDWGCIIGTFTVNRTAANDMVAMGEGAASHLYYVCIHPNESEAPHFHVFDKTGMHRKESEKNGFHACVAIQCNKYVKNGPYTDELDKDMMEALDNMMCETRGENRADPGMTNFRHTVLEWNDNNAEKGTPGWVDPNTEKPNYKRISGTI